MKNRYNEAGAKMDELKYELLTEVNGRMQADLLKSYLEAEGIELKYSRRQSGIIFIPS